jgi:hypothetical protein
MSITIIYLSWSWATCCPVPVSRVQRSLQRSVILPNSHPHLLVVYPVLTNDEMTTDSQRYNCFIRNGGNAIPKHAGPEAKGSNPTTGRILLRVRNPFTGEILTTGKSHGKKPEEFMLMWLSSQIETYRKSEIWILNPSKADVHMHCTYVGLQFLPRR